MEWRCAVSCTFAGSIGPDEKLFVAHPVNLTKASVVELDCFQGHEAPATNTPTGADPQIICFPTRGYTIKAGKSWSLYEIWGQIINQDYILSKNINK